MANSSKQTSKNNNNKTAQFIYELSLGTHLKDEIHVSRDSFLQTILSIHNSQVIESTKMPADPWIKKNLVDIHNGILFS